MQNQPNLVTIKILNKTFKVCCPPGKEPKLMEAANMLCDQVTALRKSHTSTNFEKLLVTAALNLTYKHLESKNDEDQALENFSSKIEQMCSNLEELCST